MLLRHRLSILLFCGAFATSAQDPLHRRITMQDGLPSNTTYRCRQDRQGFIWIATDAGAVRFDGADLDQFGPKQGLPDEDVFDVTEDELGRIWFHAANGRPSYLDQGVVQGWRTDSLLAKIHVRSGIISVHMDANGSMWFGGLRSELVVLHRDGSLVERNLGEDPIRPRLGRVEFLAKEDGGVQVFNDRVPKELEGLARPSGNKPMAGQGKQIDEWSSSFFNVSSDHIDVWREGRWIPMLHREELPGSPALANAFPIGDHELWVCLRSGGVLWLRYEAGKWVQVRDLMFDKDLISSILQDREGNIWLCTAYGGVISISAQGKTSTFFSGQRGTNEEFLRAHASDSTGVWVGTNRGDLYRLGKGLEFFSLPSAGPAFSKVSSIGSQGKVLWITTEHRIFRSEPPYELRNVVPLSTQRNAQDPERMLVGFKALASSSDGRVVTSSYGLFELDLGSMAFRPMLVPNIPQVRIYAPYFDAKGTLWFEENGSLNSISKDGSHDYPDIIVKPSYRITDITSIGDTLFIATNGQGLLVAVDGVLLNTITTADGISSDHIRHIFQQGDDLFVVSSGGADRLSGPWSSPRSHSYAAVLSGASHRVRDVVADSASVYVLLDDGLMRLPRHGPFGPACIPKPYIRSVFVNDNVVLDPGIVGIRSGRDRLTLEFAAIHFAAPEQVRLQYRIGGDGNWRSIFSRLLDFSTLGAGDHVLQLRASSDARTWSEPIEFKIIVVPAIMERWWAIVLMAFLASALVLVLIRYVVNRRYLARMAQMRQQEQLAAARQRLAMDLHDDLGAELSSLLLLTRMERDQPTPDSLQRVEQMLGALADKVKEVIWTTDPGADTLESTLIFIQRYAIKQCELHGLRVRTSIPQQLPQLELVSSERRELYLLAKEALNNTVKHAGATAVTLAVALVEDSLVLDIADDGQGGVTAITRHAGRGVQNMVMRAERLGAYMVIREVQPHGTRIILTLPLDRYGPNG